MDLDLLPHHTSDEVATVVATPNVGPAAGSIVMLGNASAVVASSTNPYSRRVDTGSSHNSNANALCMPPPLKRTTTNPKSRLTVEGAHAPKNCLAVAGAPSALTTPKVSSSVDGLRLLKSMGFDFKHATLLICFSSFFNNLSCVSWSL